MKKFYALIVTILATLLSGSVLLAQVPGGFNYQAIARDVSTGNPISNATLNVRIAILSSISPIQVAWEEEHLLSSNEFGLFTLEVGDPSATYVDGSAGSFSAIDWTAGTYYLRPSVKQAEGNWQVMTPTQLIAVPFAMLAKDVENKQQISKSGDFIILTDGGSVDLSPYLNPDQTINLDENILSISGNTGSNVDLSAYIDENQTISKDGNIISLDGGGGIVNLGEYVNQFDANADTLKKSTGSLVLGPDDASGSILKLRGSEIDPDAPLFEVKNQAGQQVFAVYDNGVQIHVDDKSIEKVRVAVLQLPALITIRRRAAVRIFY